MVSAFLATLWDKIPWYVKYTILLMFLPLQLKDWSTQFVRSEVHAVVMPLKTERDLELKHLAEDIGSMKTDIREIRIHLLGSNIKQKGN